jgi:hypothetical protein
MAALAGDLEGDIVGGVALDLEGAGREVVEVLVEKLAAHSQRCDVRALVWGLSRNAAPPRASFSELGIARTSFAALAISEKAGTDMLAMRVEARL